jgi:hypothetical protein
MQTEDVNLMNKMIDSSGFSYEIARHKLQELRDEWGEERFFQALGGARDIVARQCPHFGPSKNPRREL